MSQHPIRMCRLPLVIATAAVLLFEANMAMAQPGVGSPSDSQPTAAANPSAEESADSAADVGRAGARQTLMASLTIFVLAVFVGFEMITKVPPTLHTPLMSGSNAISGITLVGAVIVTGVGLDVTSFVGLFAVILATINVVGGFLVTHRMLSMFRKK